MSVAPPLSDDALLDNALEADLSEQQREIVDDMVSKGRRLSTKQRKLLEAFIEGTPYEAEPEYLNLVSRGLVPRGREVETPEVLRNLPKLPPGRTK